MVIGMEKYRVIVKGVIQYEDKYLVVCKWYDDRVAEPYQWEFIDGVIEFGEAPDKAVIRLINDQTGLSATIDRILYTWSFMIGDEFSIGISYLCRVTFDEVVLCEELKNCRWILKEEMSEFLDNKVLEDIERADLK
jgi:nucleoside triphosphatase